MLGFGGALTDSSCYLFSRMEPEQRRLLLRNSSLPDGLRFSVGRTCIGSSDYSRTAYTYRRLSGARSELNNFSIDHDRAYILPMLREALQIQPGLMFVSTPWSPPAWMKAGDSLFGGSMRKHYFKSYAEYFVEFIEAYRDSGIHIRAVTMQNEVDTDQDGRMPAALWGQEYEAEFIKEFLGPAFERRLSIQDLAARPQLQSMGPRGGYDERPRGLPLRRRRGLAWLCRRPEAR